MRTDLDETLKTVAYRVFQVQKLLAVNPTDPKWCTVNWSAFRKQPERSCREYLFIHSTAGKRWVDHPDRPSHYYGENFWTDTPTFMTYETARNFMSAVVRGGYCKRDEVRVVEINSVTTLEVR